MKSYSAESAIVSYLKLKRYPEKLKFYQNIPNYRLTAVGCFTKSIWLN
jgi:hypothetical protein